MVLVDLKHGNCEEIIANLKPHQRLSKKIIAEVADYDEYWYLTGSGNVVKGFRQEFVKDPYMKLDSIPYIRLLTYEPEIRSLADLEEAFSQSSVPIITRVHPSIDKADFADIESIAALESIIRPMRINIQSASTKFSPSPFIRQMSKEDLLYIEKMFREQYSLRYKMVGLMYAACPQACFVYENQRILGISFNRIEDKTLHM